VLILDPGRKEVMRGPSGRGGRPVIRASHSIGPIDVLRKEGEAMGSNKFGFQTVRKKYSGGNRI
jgi:hypothetical protein